MTDTATRDQHNAYRRSLVVSVLFLAVLFVLLNLQPFRWYSCPTFVDDGLDYRHGVPFTYMTRDLRVRGAGFSWYHGPWPLQDPTSLCSQFNGWMLVLDISMAAGAILLVGRSLARLLVGFPPRLTRCCLTLLIAMVACWLVIIADSLVAIARSDLLFPPQHQPITNAWLSDIVLLIAPAILYPVIVCWTFVELVHWAILPGAWATPRPLLVALNTILVGLFLAYSVGEWGDFAEPVEILTWAGLVVTLGLLALKLGRWLHHTREPPARANEHHSRFLGLSFTAWLWTVVMACTIGTFSLLDVSSNTNEYGWPWIHFQNHRLVESSIDYWTLNGWKSGTLQWPLLAANIAVLLWIAAGTAVAVQAMVSIRRARLKFGIRNLISITTAIAVLMAFWEPAGRSINWPNWFVEFMAGLGLGCAGFLLARVPALLWERFAVRKEEQLAAPTE